MTTPKRDKKTGRFLSNPRRKKRKSRPGARKITSPGKKKPVPAPKRSQTTRDRKPWARRSNKAKRNPDMPQARRDALEMDVDAFQLAGVLEALGRVCHEKAEHLIHNWQDTYSARPWTKLGNRIDNLVAAAEGEGL